MSFCIELSRRVQFISHEKHSFSLLMQRIGVADWRSAVMRPALLVQCHTLPTGMPGMNMIFCIWVFFVLFNLFVMR